MDDGSEESDELSLPADSNYSMQDLDCACFRCGLCCRLWVFVNYEEADRIADRVKMLRSQFTIEYWDRTVSTEECLVLDQKDGACIFLGDGKNGKYCQIYNLRPRVCREYVPSLLRRECKRGLSQYWNLKVTPTGRIVGDEAQIKSFNNYLKEIVIGQTPKDK